MKKVVEISFVGSNQLICLFDNNEERLLNLESVLKDEYGKKILSDKSIFESAQIGQWGEIFWSDAAEITNLNGEREPCNYDISPEFAYANSSPISVESQG